MISFWKLCWIEDQFCFGSRLENAFWGWLESKRRVECRERSVGRKCCEICGEFRFTMHFEVIGAINGSRWMCCVVETRFVVDLKKRRLLWSLCCSCVVEWSGGHGFRCPHPTDGAPNETKWFVMERLGCRWMQWLRQSCHSERWNSVKQEQSLGKIIWDSRHSPIIMILFFFGWINKYSRFNLQFQLNISKEILKIFLWISHS